MRRRNVPLIALLGRLAIVLIALACLLVVTASCEDEEEEPTADEWVERGKELLAAGDGAGAYLAFQGALDLEDNNVEAHYGVVLADVLQFTGTIELLGAMLEGAPSEPFPPEVAGQVCQTLDGCGLLDALHMTYAQCVEGGGALVDMDTIACILDAPNCEVIADRCIGIYLPPSAELCLAACVRFASCGYFLDTNWYVDECVAGCDRLYTAIELECFTKTDQCSQGRDECFANIGDTITALVEEFWSPIGEGMGQSIAAVRAHDDFHFDLDFYSVTLIDPFLRPTFSGTHDQGDLYFFSAVYSAIDALFSLGLGLNFDLNPLLLADLGLQDIGGQLGLFTLDDDGGGEFAASLAELVTLLDQILGDPVYGEFLRLRTDAGEGYVRAGGAELGWIFGNLALMVQTVDKETDDQRDDVIRFIDENRDGLWNDPEPLLIPGVAELEYELAWILHDLFLALKVDLTDGYAFQFEQLTPLLDYLGFAGLSLVIDMLDLAGVDAIDLGQVFRDPDPDGLRPLLTEIQALLQMLQETL